MKKIVFLSVFLFLAQFAWSQKSITPVAGFQQYLNLQQITFRLSAAPLAGFSYDRHQVLSGPVVLLKTYRTTEEKSPLLSGFQTTYGYRLTKKEEAAVNFSVEFTGRVQSFKEEWTSNYWNGSLQKYQDIPSGSREILVEGLMGFSAGFRLNKFLELKSAISGGYFDSFLRPLSGLSPASIADGYDYRFYKNSGAAFSFGTGLIWYIKGKK